MKILTPMKKMITTTSCSSQAWADATHLARDDQHAQTAPKPFARLLTPPLLVVGMVFAVLCGLTNFDQNKCSRNSTSQYETHHHMFVQTGSIYDMAVVLKQELAGDQLLAVLRTSAGSCQLVDLLQNRCLDTTISIGMNPVRAAISKSGELYVIGYHDNSVTICDLKNSKETTFAHDNKIFSIAASPDNRRVALSGYNGDLVVYQRNDAGDWTQQYQWKHKNHSFNLIEFSNNSELLFCASTDAVGKIWDVTSEELLLTTEGHLQSITAAKFINNDEQLITTGVDGRSLFGNIKTRQKVHEIYEPISQFTSLSCDATGTTLILGSSAGHICWFQNARNGLSIKAIAHKGAIPHLNYHPEQNRFYSCSHDGEAIAWKLNKDRFDKETVVENLRMLSDKN